MWKKKLRTLLKETLESDQTNAPTLRHLAKTLDINPGALSGIINGKRNLSKKAAQQIISLLPIELGKKRQFEEQFKKETDGERMLLPNEFEIVLSKWFYLPILCLFECDPPPKTVEDVGKRLGLTTEEVGPAVEALLEMRLLKNEEGLLTYIGPYWTTTDEISSRAIRTAHLNDLHLAARVLNYIPMESRDFTSITFAGNSSQLKRVKKEIRKVRERVNQIMEEGNCDHVYKFNIQLFPVDNGESEH